jgi:hypothetical protein
MTQWREQVFQTVDLDLVDRSEHVAELTFGESLPGEPDNVVLGKVYQKPPRVSAEGHPHPGQFKERLVV